MPKAAINKRIIYSIVIVITIAAGLLVRRNRLLFPDAVNLYLGDMLYAFMMFYIVSLIVPAKSNIDRAAIALAVCYCIEFLQLYQAPWINEVRLTLPGRLILGSGFLWSDLLAYLLGVSVAFLMDKFWLSHTKTTG